jgi:tetratricopeptide (TPR) repeat protein
MKRYGLLFFVTLYFSFASAQNRVIDSLDILLSKEIHDTTRVTLLWNLASAYNSFNPDTARALAEEALFLAQKIKYVEGESKSLGKLANAFNQIGNYPSALEFYLRQLKLEEKRNNPQNMTSVLLNIGSVYLYQEEYDKALDYYYRADSLMHTINATDSKFGFTLKYAIALDIGDLYNRIGKMDSAIIYFQRSLNLATQQKDGNYMGTSMVGIAEVYLHQKLFEPARNQFKDALVYLEAAQNDDLVCEASWGLATLYDSLHRNDSTKYYAQRMLSMARKDGFIRWQLKAAQFLDAYYKKIDRTDSAYAYLVLSQQLRDSINSNDQVRKLQVMSSNEQLRQNEIAEQKRIAKKERRQQLQFLLIGMFIPALFLFTLLISRRKVHVRVIRFLGIISLLIFFEYLTLLLHPYVADLTGHTPIYELLIFVCIAAILIRTHHRIEDWFVSKLIHSRQRLTDGKFPIRRIKIKMKKPPGTSNPG